MGATGTPEQLEDWTESERHQRRRAEAMAVVFQGAPVATSHNLDANRAPSAPHTLHYVLFIEEATF